MDPTFKKLIFIICIVPISFAAWKLFFGKKPETKKMLAQQAYTYLFPLVEMNRLKTEQTTKFAPINKFYHFQKLLTHEDREVVTPNNDTLYSIAWVDLSNGPVVLHIPEIKDRYFVMELLDAYTNNFENIGSRTRKKTKQIMDRYFELIPPGETRPKILNPNEPRYIFCPTNIVWILGRTLVDGEEDIPNVIHIQKQYTLTPRAEFNPKKIGNNSYGTWKPSQPDFPDFKKEPIAFFKMAGTFLRNNPIPKKHAEYFKKFTSIGLTKKGFNFSKLSKHDIRILSDTAAEGRDYIKTLVDTEIQKHAKNINNWELMLGDIGNYGKDYAFRAAVALAYIGALVPQEAVYPKCAKDITGKKLTGEQKYTLKFEKDTLPPAKAFWSLTIYNAKDFFLVPNPINRYSIGNRTKGLQKNEDGSLEIYIQKEQPVDAKHLANWLPAPAEDFYLILRIYNPEESILTGKYEIPGIQRVA